MDSEHEARARVIAEMSSRHTREILESGNTHGIGVGRPLVLLITRGARTGKTRYSPVIRVEHEGSYAVVGSKGALPAHPDWYFNLKAHPEISLQDGTLTQAFLAHEAEGSERAEWWQRAAAIYPNYDVMQTETERRIPLFVLEPL